MVKLKVFCTVFAIVLFGAFSAFAQTTAQITGQATSGGSPLPGVTVTISSPQMQGTRTAVTGNDGGFSFNGIPPGTYSARFELSGLAPVTKSVTVGLSQTGRADADLKVSSVSEAITVTAAAPSVLETPTASQNLSAKLTALLPTSRTVIGTAALAPGVTTNTTAGNQVSISGSPGYDNLVMVNGVVITEDIRSQALPLFIEDAIQETTVMTGAISAEYGRFTGGVVNSISKSGGNQFSGSFRQSLSNPQWTSRTPLQKTNNTLLRNATGRVNQATLGGFILKDRLWFFGAGRQTKSDTVSSLRAVPGAFAGTANARPGDATKASLPVDTLTNEKRYEAKLTGQITSKHNLAGSYLKTDQRSTDSFFTTTAYDVNQLTNRFDPYRLKTANYNGILTNNWLLEGTWSKMTWGVAEGSGSKFTDFIQGSLVRNRADANARWNSATFCGVCDKETRTNNSWNAKTSYFLSSKNLGNQNIIGGIENFQEHRHANNYQSGSNWRVFVNQAARYNNIIYPTICPPAAAGTANAGCNNGTSVSVASATMLIWTPIFNNQQGESDLQTQSAFVNDRWDLNDRWSFNLGVRYDKNHTLDGTGNLVANDHRISPRLSVTRDVTGNGKHRITGSFSQYASRVVDGPATAASSAGSPGYIYYLYNGPAINPAGTAVANLVDTRAALAIVQNWFKSACGVDPTALTVANPCLSALRPASGHSVPGYDTKISGSLNSPYVNEVTIGYGAEWFSNLVTRVDLIKRDWKDFYGYRVDKSTPLQTDPLGIVHDVAVVENTNLIKRAYRGVQFQSAWHPNRLNFGLNYTYSNLKGNDDQESATSGTVGNSPSQTVFPELRNFANNKPNGYLASDQTHRVRTWVSYDLPTPAVLGLITGSVLQNYDSGLSYSAVGTVDLTNYYNSLLAGSKYVGAGAGQTYYFSKRGAYRTPNVQSTNLSLNWERPISRVAVYAHIDYTNVFNRQSRTSIITTVNTAANTTNLLPFNPFTDTPVECAQGTALATCKTLGANWQKAATFGTTTSLTGFQTPRTYSGNFGFRF